MNTIVCLVVLGVLLAFAEAKHCSVTVTGDIDHDFEGFINCYYPNYKPDKKHRERMEKFKKCYGKFTNHTGTNLTHHIGFTPFCYLTDDEVNAGKNNHLRPEVMPPGEIPSPKYDSRQPLPAKVDWRTRNAVTTVKQQGQCGSCYTFAAVAALEGAYAIKTGKLVEFSQQQYVDCSYQYTVRTWSQNSCDRKGVCNKKSWDTWEVVPGRGNQGCNGGDYRSAWAYNNQSRQPETLATCYPYSSDKSLRNGACQYNANCQTKAVVSGYVNVKDDVTAVMQAVANNGPLACAMNADTIKYYKGGIVETVANNINHAITVVGYGSENGKDYWLVKNSWSASWGEAGYFRLLRKQYAAAVGALGLCSCSFPVLA